MASKPTEGPPVDRRELEKTVYELCKRSPEGADFLITTFLQALRHYRRPTICAPFPLALFNTGGALPEKDFRAAEDCIAHIPRIPTIVEAGPPGPSEDPPGTTAPRDHPLAKLPEKALRLLHWILSYRHEVRLVEDPARELATLFPEGHSPWSIPGNGLGVSPEDIKKWEALRPHYVMEIRDPEDGCLDRATEFFEAARAEAGSFIAYHGSPAENVHCILRCGLLNMTNTQHQRNGAIFGDGIYLSTDRNVGFMFADGGEGWERSCLWARARYVLMAEVANGPGVSRSHSSAPESHSFDKEEADDANGQLGTYILVLNKDLIKVRYVFVYVEKSRCLPEATGGVREATGVATRGPVGGLVQAAGAAPTQASPGSARLRKVDWCTVFVIAYMAVLVGVGIIDSEILRHVRLPAALQMLR